MFRALVVSLAITTSVGSAESGLLPVGADGQPLNLDFETGDLRDWLVEGIAFEGQPIQGDTVAPRRRDSRSQHQGKYWIGGYEKHKDLPKGRLISAPFEVTHPYASFLVGGGPHQLQTCVEIVRRDSQKVIFRAAGRERENMHREIVDLREHQGKQIFVRLIDEHTGHWGHVNFDDFRFHKQKPKFASPKRVVDVYEHAGLSAEKAAQAMTLPKGFTVEALAAEPDIRQPIAMTIDDRGRVWVAEAYAYPTKAAAKDAKDRILIFEDSDGNGSFEKRTIFIDKLNLVSGLEVGFGGVWVGQAPELLFIPDRNGDDRPDGPPEVVLDGWGFHDTHETLNSFIWGPDGWLYGCHGVFTHSRVGKPGTPPAKRIPINAGIWRYHPTQKMFEVFAYGTSNPWGVDFNDKGHAFLTCCVIPHLFHVIQGARYQRQAGSHFQQHTYADIPTIAKHRHWVGNQWNDADRAKSDANGGGHAHAGAMIYLGGAWPKKYRNQLFMNNIHGARLNVDSLTPYGSGYVGDGEPDFCKTNDLWSQIIYLRSGPDGQVYTIDWYDRNQCHHRTAQNHDRSNGRLFRIAYQGYKPVQVDLAKLSDVDLVQCQLHVNDWYVRHARRLLQERAIAGKLTPTTRDSLAKIAYGHSDVTRRLRGLWALHVTGGLSEEQIAKGLADPEADVRAWTIQLACETKTPREVLPKFAELAKSDPAAVVRLYLASALQRIPLENRWPILEGLLTHDDHADHNLPLMYWYAAEPLATVDASRVLQLATSGRGALVAKFMVRRVTAIGTPEALASVLESVLTSKTTLPLLTEMQTALSAKRKVPMPKNWGKVFDVLGNSKDATLRNVVWSLAVKFGDPTVQRRMRDLLGKKTTPSAQRRQYLATLLAADDKALVPILHGLLDEQTLRREALQGLARFAAPETAEKILARYKSYTSPEKRAALSTLVSRESYAQQLLLALAEKRVPTKDLTADLVRQVHNLRNPAITEQLERVWGTVRQSPAEKAKLIAQWKRKLAKPAPVQVRPLGRALFAKTCQRCHTLFGTGGDVGPDLTGSNRADLDYLLSNVIDPSAVLGKDYLAHVVETKSGQVLTGLIREQTPDAVTLVTTEQTLILPRSEIDSITQSDKSMMPDDLLKPLSDAEIRALVGYLSSPRQVPLLATTDNATSLFNGKDFSGWIANPKYWKIDDGEIVGTRPAEKNQRNEFLIGELLVRDFRLSLQVKLTPNTGNSGVQFRSELLPDNDVKGYQADIGSGWWGKLYEEHGRGLLWSQPGDAHVQVGEWNTYVIHAEGDRIRTYLNGKLCVDLVDAPGRKQGHLALQLHSGAPFEVRFRELKLEVLDGKK